MIKINQFFGKLGLKYFLASNSRTTSREFLTLLLVSESPRQLVAIRANISGSFSRKCRKPCQRPSVSSRFVPSGLVGTRNCVAYRLSQIDSQVSLHLHMRPYPTRFCCSWHVEIGKAVDIPPTGRISVALYYISIM